MRDMDMPMRQRPNLWSMRCYGASPPIPAGCPRAPTWARDSSCPKRSGDAGGASIVLDAGDDTSTGEPWEAFSLDSLQRSFEDFERFGVAGNHDHGEFVSTYLADLGWTMLDGEVVEGPGATTLLGIDDPRSSGLGTWRDEKDLSFADVEERIADDVCELDEQDERIATLLQDGPRRAAMGRAARDVVREA